MLYIKFGFDWSSGFREQTFEYSEDIHVYCPGVGAHEPLGSIFFRIINIQSYCPFHFTCHFKSFPHSNALATDVDLAVK